MAGMMYLGNQKVTPVIVQGGGEEPTGCVFRIPDDVTEISKNYLFQGKFSGFPYPLDVDLNNLEIVSGRNALSNAFNTGSGGNYFRAKHLRVLSGASCCSGAFQGLKQNDVDFDFSTIEEISGANALEQAFTDFPKKQINFSSLSVLTGEYAFVTAFYDNNDLEIYFPSLTSQSFGNYTNQFSLMLIFSSNCTVHFPSNLESVIGEWSDVLSGFDGTNTTVLFDLEATS